MIRQFLDRLKGVQRISDPVFGPLARRGANGLLEGIMHFPPTGESVELLIDSSTGVPTAHQHQYWLELQQRYAELLPEIRTSLRLDPTDLGDSRAAGDFRLVVIDLQSDDPFSGDVELTYEFGGDIRSVALRGWQPTEAIPE